MEVESAGLHTFNSLLESWASLLPATITNTVAVNAHHSTNTTRSAFLCTSCEGWTPVVDYTMGRCFFRGVVLQLPTLVALIAVPITLYFLRKKPLVRQHSPVAQRRRFAVQSVLSLALLGLLAAESVLEYVGNGHVIAEIGVIAPLLLLLSLLPAAVLSYVELHKMTKPSAALLLYWLSFVLVRVLALTAQPQQPQQPHSLEIAVAVVGTLIFLVEWLQPRRERPDLRFNNPYDRADLFSRLSFAWLTPLMRQGYEHYLTNDDLPELASSDRADACNEKFESNWHAELDAGNTSVLKAILKSFGLKFALGGVFKLVQDTMAFIQPQLLKILILFVAEYRLRDGDMPLTRGIYIAFGMFLVSVVQTLMLHQYFERAFGTGMNIRTSVTNAIFRKSLVLSNEARATRTTGDTVNLMSIDTQRLQDVCSNGHMIWSGPLQITLCLVSLYKLMGPSMWVGVFILVVLIPINSYLAQMQKTLQQRQMRDKDTRTRLTSELLSSIKSIKLYAWEDAFVSRLKNVRDNHELVGLKKLGVFMACMSYVFNMTPFIVSCSTFACYVFVAKKSLTTEIVFPALMLFNMLGFPMAVFPMLISSLIEARVAVNRITNYLTGEELQENAVERLPRAEKIGDVSVELANATFVYRKENATRGGPYALHNSTFTARKGELSCVVGKVGSGKTSLLMSILGNTHKTEGTVKLAGSVGYVAQNPWIFNGSVRENILFGLKYDEDLYAETIAACALKDDLAILPDGDGTVVGEKGLSLSGGQKARVSLARAVYARADVYLLDDPLSAVDENVGHHIITHVLSRSGLLASKTVILATNSIPVLQHADHLAMIVDGEIVEQGTPADRPPRITALLKEFGRKDTSAAAAENEANENEAKKRELEASAEAAADVAAADVAERSPDNDSAVDEQPEVFTGSPVESGAKSFSARRGSTRRPSAASLSATAKPLEVRGEHVEKGKVSWSVYMEYAKACGWNRVVLFWCMLIVSTSFSVGSNVWLKRWAESNSEYGYNKGVVFFISVYAVLGIISCSLQVLQALVAYTYLNQRAARLLHDKMLSAVVRAPMAFFETTPLGRIVNRFSSDVYRVDQQLIRVFFMLFNNCVKVFFTILIICYSTPAFLILSIPITYFYLYYQRYYLRTSRELKRLDSVSKSPIFAQFQETLDGIATVRAFDATARFNHTNRGYIDTNNRAYFPSISANRWLAVRLEFLGSLVIFAASGLSVLSLPSGRISAGVIGLALSYALQTTQSLNWIVRMTVDVETNIVSVERMMEYSSLQSEAPPIIDDHRPQQDWPQQGAIKLNDYSTRYRPELPLILKNIGLEIKAGEKIGIVGRTGAGKSSLTLALFRLIEPAGGNITVDSVNTSEIGLKDLRSNLSIIPQDSQLFEGSVRENLDPVGRYTDEQLWRSLELSHLKAFVSKMDAGLDSKVSEGGSNLSSGQRQLLSLARALLTDSKILVLDEATAAVDVETDKLVQEVIRKEFSDRTILTIAHRLNTILDSDKVVVLDYGKVIEFDSPGTLMKDPTSMFSALCRRGGIL